MSTGRKIKLDREIQDKIINLIKAGNYSKQAAGAAGISERTFWRWMQQGEAASKKFEIIEEQIENWNDMNYEQRIKNIAEKPLDKDIPSTNQFLLWQFWQEVKRAEAEGEALLVTQIKMAGKDSWQALAWILERKHRDRWGRQSTVEVSGEIEHKHKLLLKSSEGEIEAAKQRILKARENNNQGQLPQALDFVESKNDEANKEEIQEAIIIDANGNKKGY